MAIYIRSCPGAGAKTLGYLCALAAVGVVCLFPAAFFLSAWALGSMDEAMTYPEDSSKIPGLLIQAVMIMTTYSFVLNALCFSATFCFKGTDQWLAKDAAVTHDDVASAQFLHVAQDPERRATGMLWAMLAGTLLVASPIIVLAIPHPLLYSESTHELEDDAVRSMIILAVVLFVTLIYAAVRRRSSAVRLTSYGMVVDNQAPFFRALPSSRNKLQVQEAPARWGRIKVQAVYIPPSKGAKPGAPVLIPRLSLTVKPSKVDDARSQVEAQLDEVWRAVELVRTPDDPAPQVPSPSESAKTSTEDHESARDSDAGSEPDAEPPGTFRA